MNRFILVLTLLISFSAFADKTVDRAAINEKVRFQTEVFATSINGKILKHFSSGWSEIRITSDRSKFASPIVLEEYEGMKKLNAEISIDVKDDLQMQIGMHQWAKVDDSRGHERKFSGSLREETQTVVNFGSVQFVIPDSATQQYVIRVTPIINREPSAEQTDYLPMSVTDVLAIDNQGRIWSQNSSASGEVVQLQGRFGAIYLSFAPFTGSKPMGSARDNEIELKTPDKMTLHIRSAKAIIGAGYSAIVHARIELGQKSPGTGISATSKANVEHLLKER